MGILLFLFERKTTQAATFSPHFNMPVTETVPISEKIKNFKNPCGFGCSLCCALYSTWGVLMLLVVGFLTKREYRGIDGDIPSIEDHTTAGVNCYYAALVYAFFIFISVLRLVHLAVLNRRKKHSLDEFAS